MSRNKQNSPSTNRLHIHIRSISNGFFDGLNVSCCRCFNQRTICLWVFWFYCCRFWFCIFSNGFNSWCFWCRSRLLRLPTPH